MQHVTQHEPSPLLAMDSRYKLLETKENCVDGIEEKMMDQAQIHKGRDIKRKEDRSKQKILIMGDSHARGIAQEFRYQLNQEFEVQGIIKPGATMKTVVST
jgi:hypothetical protein